MVELEDVTAEDVAFAGLIPQHMQDLEERCLPGRDAVTNAAERVGLHDIESDRIEDHFSQHNIRHWFTTHLRRAGMRREFIQELRGDSRREAIDIYDHIDQGAEKRLTWRAFRS